jgi:hypothetical protein
MGFWGWFFVFTGIFLLTVFAYAALALRILEKLKAVEAPATKLSAFSLRLKEARETTPEVNQIIAAMDQGSLEVSRRRKAVTTARKSKKETKERRLVERLKSLDFDESRLRK